SPRDRRALQGPRGQAARDPGGAPGAARAHVGAADALPRGGHPAAHHRGDRRGAAPAALTQRGGKVASMISPPDVVAPSFALLRTMEETQKAKVIDLARRLKPGLTAEDIRNPHDFPDLDDPDWHFEDGQLTGIQSVKFALRSLSRELLPDGDEAGEEEGQGEA